MQKSSLRALAVVVLIVVAGVGVSQLSLGLTPNAGEQPLEQQQRTAISFTRQASDGQSVVLSSVTLSSGGFVAIHDSSVEGQQGDSTGSILGVSRYLSAGTHENVTITLSDPVNTSEASVQVIARPYRDTNDNRVFDYVTANGTVDRPYRSGGGPISDSATLELSDGPLPPQASLTLGNQTAGDTVLVRDVTLSAGGFVTLVDEEGEIIGVSRYLRAQKYERVRVAVVTRPDGRINVTARAHRDTDGDRVFGFEISDGRVDGPYQAGQVTDTASVRFTSETTSPTSPTSTPAFSVAVRPFFDSTRTVANSVVS